MEQILQQPFLSRQVSVFGDGVVMKLIVVIAFIVVAAFADLAQAQQSAKMPRVAYLSNARFSEIPIPRRRIPARASRVGLHGGEEYCSRVARGNERSSSRACLRGNRAQGGRHRRGSW